VAKKPQLALRDDSASGLEEELLPLSMGRRRLALAALSGVAAMTFTLGLLWPATGMTVVPRFTNINQPLPGITLQPSIQTLPGLPDSLMPSTAHHVLLDPDARIDAVTARYEPEEPKPPSVVFSLLIENLDFWQLTEHSNILTSFKATVRQAVASVAGNDIDSDDIQLALSAGSVIVECIVAVPSASVAESVQAALEFTHRLTEDLALNLEALVRLDMFQTISTGRIMVARISAPVIDGTTKPPTTTTGLTTSPSLTLPMTPWPTTTRAQTCKGIGESCFVSAQCCSRRCLPSHECGTSMAWV